MRGEEAVSPRLVPLRLAGGMWEGLWEGADPPRLVASHTGIPLPPPEAAETEGGWLVRLRLPVELIAEGVQTVVIADAGTGGTLARITLVAGEVLADDLRAEIDLLRAELDMLKRAFRRHCLETGGA
ncbi:hypothetical protein [Rubellimicrobium sp. CFH 75288]|uniref:hypothetical protein n=1 Tax=Rubellimicrobium sp. CFH 75288 TaxID=2697034 RepID=UPI00352AB1BF